MLKSQKPRKNMPALPTCTWNFGLTLEEIVWKKSYAFLAAILPLFLFFLNSHLGVFQVHWGRKQFFQVKISKFDLLTSLDCNDVKRTNWEFQKTIIMAPFRILLKLPSFSIYLSVSSKFQVDVIVNCSESDTLKPFPP